MPKGSFSYSMRQLFLIGFSLVIFHDSISGATLAPTNEKDNAVKAEPAGTLEWMRQKRNAWGKVVGDTGKRLDGFFAGDEVIYDTNDSFLKIALKAEQSSGGRSQLDPEFKFRLDLPALKERLKIVIESEAQETKSLEEKNRKTEINDEQKQDTVIGALKVETKKHHSWKASTSVGIDFQLPADPFWRSNGNYRWDINQHWDFTLRQDIYYFHIDGWGETTQLTFEHPSDAYVFRAKSQAKYNHRDRRTQFAQIFSIIKELSKIRAIEPRIGILGQNKPVRQTTAYFLDATYRRKLYSNWLFYELKPELLFPRDDNFNLQPSFSAKIEIVFSSHE